MGVALCGFAREFVPNSQMEIPLDENFDPFYVVHDGMATLYFPNGDIRTHTGPTSVHWAPDSLSVCDAEEAHRNAAKRYIKR